MKFRIAGLSLTACLTASAAPAATPTYDLLVRGGTIYDGSDADSQAPEGPVLLSSTHPRAYGNFARLLAKYVREEERLTLQEAVRKLSAQPAHNLGLRERGLLKAGCFADVVVFDPATIQDHAAFEKPQQFATGVSEVVVNGQLALEKGEPTAARSGKVVRGRGWTGWPDGGCKASAKDWRL